MTVPQQAQTLLQMRDAVPPIPRLADCTVLLIDWQEEYRSRRNWSCTTWRRRSGARRRS